MSLISWYNKRMEILALRNRFKAFISDTPKVIQQLESELPSIALDYSLLSLTHLDNSLKQIKSRMKGRSEEWWISRIAAYVGDTIRKSSGAKWLLDENPASENYGLAILKSKTSFSISPFRIVLSAWHNQTAPQLHECAQNFLSNDN